MRTFKQQLILGVCLLTLLGCMTSCNGAKNETTAEAVIKVKTIVVSSSLGNGEREYVGAVQSENRVDLSFETNGNIAQIYVQEGQSVAKGQLLARLNTVHRSKQICIS
jgi:multidrug efflux pump subunit AcrA (membrane-fusion protein)